MELTTPISKVYFRRLIIINKDFLEGYKCCLKGIIKTINNSIKQNNDANTLKDTVKVFNDLIELIEDMNYLVETFETPIDKGIAPCIIINMDKEGRRD